MRKSVALLWLAAVSVPCCPRVAGASGAFRSRFVHKRFSYTYREHVRKIFRDGEQSRLYFAEKERAFHRRLAVALPGVERVLAGARRRKIPIVSYSVTHPVIRLPRVADVARVSRAAYPLNLALEQVTPRSTETLELSFSHAPRPGDLAWLVTAVMRALSAKVNDENAPATAVLQTYEPAVCALSGAFGLYVGARVKTDRAGKASLEAAFSAELKRLLPAMAKKLAGPGAMDELGVAGGLLPLEPVVKQRSAAEPCAVFNPYGPLVDGAEPSLVRTSLDKGSMQVVVMIAPRAYDWGKVNLTFRRWLGELLIDEHHRRAAREQSFLVLMDKNGNQRGSALSELAQNREPRFERLLSRIILDRREPESLREEAVRVLARFDAPRPYRTLVKLLAASRDPKQQDGALAEAVRALAAYPRREAVELLIGIRNNKKAEWNTRVGCDEALSRIAAGLPAGHPLKKKIVGLREL